MESLKGRFNDNDKFDRIGFVEYYDEESAENALK